MESLAEKIKEYKIKIPVYVSDNIDDEKHLFGSTFSDMLTNAKELIDRYNNTPDWHITSDRRSKTSVTGVNKIDYFDYKIGDDDCLLLQATAYKTNLVDGYLEGEDNDIILFKENDKLCSNTHFILLYPNIFSKINNKNVVYWRIFVYEDPTKSNDEVTKVAKLIMREVVKCPIKNIKEDKLLSDLKNEKIIESIEIKFLSFNDDGIDDTPPYLKNYIIENKSKKERNIKLENVNSVDAIKVFDNTELPDSFNKRQVQFLMKNKRVLTVTQEYYENLKIAFDDSFNYSFTINEDELQNVFEKDFIINKMKEVISNFAEL